MDKGLGFHLVSIQIFHLILPRYQAVKPFKVYSLWNGLPHVNWGSCQNRPALFADSLSDTNAVTVPLCDLTKAGLDLPVDSGARSHGIRGTSRPAIINDWSYLIWLGFCQGSDRVTSVPLSSFLGVSGGEGIATGKHTQMQTLAHIDKHTQSHSICWFPARSAQGFGAFSGLNSCVLVFRDHNQGH